MISQVEKGQVALPEPMIAKFADALYTTPATLLGFENVRIDPVSGYPVYEDINIDRVTEDEQMNRTRKFYERYQAAPPEIQAAIDTLLGYHQSDA